MRCTQLKKSVFAIPVAAASLLVAFSVALPRNAVAAVPSSDALTVINDYESKIDAILTATDAASVQQASAQVLAKTAAETLGIRQALASTNLATARAYQDVTILETQVQPDGSSVVSTTVDHSYDLVMASTGATETTWTDSVPTTFTLSSTGLDVTDVVETGLDAANEDNAEGSAPLGPDTSMESTPADSTVYGVPIGSYVPEGGSGCSNPPSYCYDRPLAVQYALAHACSTCHDPKWYYYSGEDCTNFMSATLYSAGGLPMVGAPHNNNSSWWYKSSGNRSYSWIRAQNFYWYMTNSGWASLASHISALIPGDIIQVDLGSPDGKIEHSMMVTKKDSTGLYVSYHSNDNKNRPLAVFQQMEPGSKYYGWIIHGEVQGPAAVSVG